MVCLVSKIFQRMVFRGFLEFVPELFFIVLALLHRSDESKVKG